jgi:hypothetical protein
MDNIVDIAIHRFINKGHKKYLIHDKTVKSLTILKPDK